MKHSTALSATGLLLISAHCVAKAPLDRSLGRRARDSRLGSSYTAIPVLRTLGGTNVVDIGLGGQGPGYETQPMNLTLSTSVNYLLVASVDCAGCISGSVAFDPDTSPTLSISQLGLEYTYASTTLVSGSSLLNVSGRLGRDTLNDGRGDKEGKTVVLVDSFVDETQSAVNDYGIRSGFNPDTEGIYGLGIDLTTPKNSVIPQALDLIDPPQDGLIVGIDMGPYSLDITQPAGVVHWGAVPEGSYRGGWNWIRPTGSLLSVWATKLNKLEINGRDVGTSGFRATIDPAQYTIIVPEATATAIYARIDGAVRDRVTTSRWNIPCDASVSFSVHLPGGRYETNSTDLVQHRSVRTCWGGIVAWPGGSAMDTQGEVLLGTPFLSNVYTAYYYSAKVRVGTLNTETASFYLALTSPPTQYVAIAAKPVIGGSVVKPIGNRLSGGAIAGIIIGLLAVMLIALGILFSRSRDSMAGYYSRVIRKQHKVAKAQMMQQYPGMEPPPFITYAQPVFSEPRHADVLYAKPFIPGGRQYEREMAMGMDPMMGMYGRQQDIGGSGSHRGSGFWGGWRRAKEESQWRQQYQRSDHGPIESYGEQQLDYSQVQPYPYPRPSDGPPLAHMYAPVAGNALGEYYGPPHGDPMQYYAQPHHTVPQEHRHSGTSEHSHGGHHHHRHRHHHHHPHHHSLEHAPSVADDGQGHPMAGAQGGGGLFDRLRNFGRS